MANGKAVFHAETRHTTAIGSKADNSAKVSAIVISAALPEIQAIIAST